MSAPPPTRRLPGPAVLPGLVVLCAWSSALGSPSFTARLAVGLVIAAVGLPRLARLVVDGDGAALLAAAFLAWAAIAAAASGVSIAWIGPYGLGTGVLLWVVGAAAWALGRAADDHRARLMVAGVLAGAAVNAGVAVAQTFTDLDAYSLGLAGGRADGLLGNPVFLGAVCAAGVTVTGPVLQRRPWAGPALVALLAAGLQASGSRIALALGVTGLAWALRRVGVDAAARSIAAGLVGVTVIALAPAVGSSTATNRAVATPASGLTPRVETWRAGLDATFAEPLTGVGPGRFVAAAGPRRSLELARSEGAQDVFEDAHDVLVEVAATTGLPGLMLFLAWLATAAAAPRAARRSPAMGAAAVLLAFHLVEPLNAATVPVALLMLGVATRRGPPARGPAEPRWQLATVVLVAAASIVGVRLVVGDATLRNASLDFDDEVAARAEGLLPAWGETASLRVRIALFEGRAERRPGRFVDAEAHARRAVAREPGRPRYLEELAAAIARQDGRTSDAAAAWADVLAANPWSIVALTGRAEALDTLDRNEAARSCRLLVEILHGDESDDAVPGARARCLAPPVG